MVGLAVFCFAMAAVTAVLAVKPRLLLALERWRFRNSDDLDYSDLELGVRVVRYGIFTVLMVGFGIGILVTGKADERREHEAESCERIMAQLEDAFGTDHDVSAVRRRASELGVQVEEETSSIVGEEATELDVTRDGELLGTLSSGVFHHDTCRD